MTGSITQLVSAVVSSDVGGLLEQGLGLILTAALIVLLVQRELVRAHGGPRSRNWIRALNLGIAPLTVAFVFVVVVRLLDMWGSP